MYDNNNNNNNVPHPEIMFLKYCRSYLQQIKQEINYQWTPGDKKFIMQQMSIVLIKVKILIIKKHKKKTTDHS